MVPLGYNNKLENVFGYAKCLPSTYTEVPCKEPIPNTYLVGAKHVFELPMLNRSQTGPEGPPVPLTSLSVQLTPMENPIFLGFPPKENILQAQVLCAYVVPLYIRAPHIDPKLVFAELGEFCNFVNFCL